MVAIALPPASWRIVVTVIVTVVGLTLTGWLSARLGEARPGPAVGRNVGVGVLTMTITWGVGRLFDIAVT